MEESFLFFNFRMESFVKNLKKRGGGCPKAIKEKSNKLDLIKSKQN